MKIKAINNNVSTTACWIASFDSDLAHSGINRNKTTTVKCSICYRTVLPTEDIMEGFESIVIERMFVE